MAVYAVAVFLSAFLLFQVQPVIGKYILPWFGGGAAVWTSCLLFFQVALLAGYAYAHLTRTWWPRGHRLAHAILLGVTLLLLPIIPQPPAAATLAASSPTWQVLLLLAATIGPPFVLLASTGPLLQSWFATTYPGRSPYRLYALSNLGSLLALLTYPVVVEPLVTRAGQAIGWSGLYLAFVAVVASLSVWTWRSGAGVEPDIDEAVAGKRPRASVALIWIGLAAAGSAMLMATTNQLSQEVAVVPFLWVLPLAVYLITFIICFEHERWYDRRVFGGLLAVTVPLSVYALLAGVELTLLAQISIYGAVLFSCCMCCHGELARRKPWPEHLTSFYLAVATGGALGGLFVGVAAPMLFNGYWEFHAALLACCGLTGVLWFVDLAPSGGWRYMPLWAAYAGAFTALAFILGLHVYDFESSALEATRSFYGALRVVERRDVENGDSMRLYHGRIRHGSQFVEEAKRHLPTSYYGPESGVGAAITYHPRRNEGPLVIGVIGLGAGTIAAYGGAGDTIRFYEIDAEVERMARRYFSYLADTPAEVEVVIGDARMRMAAEVASGATDRYDILVVDAFSGDAIPIHLLTREAVEMYWTLLEPDGLLAFHVSNRFVNLRPVIRGIAGRADADVVSIRSSRSSSRGTSRSSWLVLTRDNGGFVESPDVRALADPWNADGLEVLWTDDFASLWSVLDFD